MSAYCKHMGADLSVGGDIVGNDVRCPYHHWTYGDGGKCTGIASGDPIPRESNLASFPTAEHLGLIWVFFGETPLRSEEHTSELQSLMRISYAVYCLKKKKQ